MIKKEKKMPSIMRDCITLVKGFGIKDDIYANGDDREVIILSKDTITKAKADVLDGLCIKRFSGNIVLSEIDLIKIKCGTIIGIGETLLKITKVGKRCFSECTLVKNKKVCSLAKEVLFAKVKW
jgi:MOSC domain-containing protein YiiM